MNKLVMILIKLNVINFFSRMQSSIIGNNKLNSEALDKCLVYLPLRPSLMKIALDFYITVLTLAIVD